MSRFKRVLMFENGSPGFRGIFGEKVERSRVGVANFEDIQKPLRHIPLPRLLESERVDPERVEREHVVESIQFLERRPGFRERERFFALRRAFEIEPSSRSDVSRESWIASENEARERDARGDENH